ncbi:MAG: hypothetical protein ACPGOY_16525 [Rhodospirillaceae bacterium]
MMLLFLLKFFGVFIALVVGYCLTIFGVMVFAKRFIHRAVAALIGVFGCLLALYYILDFAIQCHAPPLYFPPETGERGLGRVIHPCDGPVGMFLFAFIYLFGPLAVAICGAFVWRELDAGYVQKRSPNPN